MSQLSISLVLLLLTVISAQQSDITRFRVIYEWNYINYTWPSPESYATAITTSKYIAENNHISGVKHFEDYLYLTVPRMKEGVPATLNRISYKAMEDNTSPHLEPYPSWEMNMEGDCNALQNVQNVEIDTNGLLWILDGGRTNTITRNPSNKCQPRLVVYDIKENRVVTTYTFPQEMTNNGSFLYDIVLDNVDGGYAYITDNSGPDPAIIVYSMKEGRAWIVRDQKSMSADEDAIHFTVNGTGITTRINIAGIALGPRTSSHGEHDIVTQDRIVYYCPLSSYKLYSVSSAVLRDEKSARTGITPYVKELGKKASQTDGMIMDENGVLYYGLLADNSIAKWDSRMSFTSDQKVIARDKIYIQWPDSLAFDMSGNLLVVTNKLQKYIYGRLNLTEPNFRILQGYVGTKSYLYSGANLDMNDQPMMNPTSMNTTTSMPENISKNNDNLYYETHTSTNTDVSQMQEHGNTNKPSSAIRDQQLNILGIILTVILLINN